MWDGQPDVWDGQADVWDGQPNVWDGQADVWDGQPNVWDGQPDVLDGQPEWSAGCSDGMECGMVSLICLSSDSAPDSLFRLFLQLKRHCEGTGLHQSARKY